MSHYYCSEHGDEPDRRCITCDAALEWKQKDETIASLQARIDALEEKVKGKCKYYRESPNEQYTPTCTGTSWSVHPEDIEGDFCQFCGGKIKLKEYTAVPYHLLEEEG